MIGRPLRVIALCCFGLFVFIAPAPASVQDATLCLMTAERVDAGETLTDA